MKKIIFLLLLFPFVNVHAQLNAYYSHCVFNTPDNKPYIETYLTVFGNSVLFKKNSKGEFQGDVEIGILFSQNGVIKVSKKYNLLSPEQKDTINRPNFIDLQRFSLDTGEYDHEILITDKNLKGKTFSSKQKVKVSLSQKQVNISDIEFLSSFKKSETKNPLTKNGYDIVPYNSDFFPENSNDLFFYAEIYNTKQILGENEKFLTTYYIQKHEDNTLLPKLIVSKREVTNSINIVLSQFNIADLSSGNYDLVIEVKNKNNQVVAFQKAFFYRRNLKANITTSDLSNVIIENTFAVRITGRDTLKEFINSLRPIASISEKAFIDNQLKLADVKLMQQFFYNFWQSRNAMFPEEEWKKYFGTVQAVNKKFGTYVFKGYQTDRGRIYLQYGPPDKRDEAPNEPNAYPYEIWHYYTLEDKSKLNPMQRNKQFIFYSPNSAAGNYELLHSDALGELYDATWEMKLQNRMNQSNDFERLNSPDHFGGNAHDDFNNPK